MKGIINLARYILLIFLTVFFGNRVVANSYFCEVIESSYVSAAGISKIEIKQVKYWMPPVFSVSPTEAQFWKDQVVKVTGGNRTSTFQISGSDSFRGTIINYSYNIKIDNFSDTATIYVKAPGYHTIGPVRYTCEATGSNKSSSVSNGNDKLKTEFNKLSQCNKKYLQQFLKGQGFYIGKIDGLWGNGTKKAVNAALKLPNFKNMSSTAFFKKIQKNPICE